MKKTAVWELNVLSFLRMGHEALPATARKSTLNPEAFPAAKSLLISQDKYSKRGPGTASTNRASGL